MQTRSSSALCRVLCGYCPFRYVIEDGSGVECGGDQFSYVLGCYTRWQVPVTMVVTAVAGAVKGTDAAVGTCGAILTLIFGVSRETLQIIQRLLGYEVNSSTTTGTS